MAAIHAGASSCVMSAAITVTGTPSSLASARRRSSRRATRTSRAPGSRAIRRAVASPIPLEAPVTRAITRCRLAWGNQVEAFDYRDVQFTQQVAHTGERRVAPADRLVSQPSLSWPPHTTKEQ